MAQESEPDSPTRYMSAIAHGNRNQNRYCSREPEPGSLALSNACLT